MFFCPLHWQLIFWHLVSKSGFKSIWEKTWWNCKATSHLITFLNWGQMRLSMQVRKGAWHIYCTDSCSLATGRKVLAAAESTSSAGKIISHKATARWPQCLRITCKYTHGKWTSREDKMEEDRQCMLPRAQERSDGIYNMKEKEKTMWICHMIHQCDSFCGYLNITGAVKTLFQ